MPIAPGLKEKLAAATQRQLDLRKQNARPKPATSNVAAGASSMVNSYKKALAASSSSSHPAATPKTNYGGTGNPLNEILYSKKQYDAGNRNWAAQNAKQYYGMLDPSEAAAVHGMNTQQLEAYINSKHKPAQSGNTGINPSGYRQPQVHAPTQPAHPAQSSQPSRPSIGDYQSSYTGPDMEGMQDQLDSLYAQRQAAAMQKLREALATALQGYNAQETQAKQSAYTNRNAADVAAAQNEQRTREMMANAGLTGDGQNLTLSAAQGASRLGALNDINQTEANALQDISQKRSLLQNNEAANEAALVQQIGADKAAALLDLLKYGDTRAFQVDQSNYGRYRDDINQQFAEDQFDWQRQTDLADLLGTFGGQRTLAGQQADLAQRNANLNAALQYSDLTGKVLSPQTDWSGLLRQAAASGALPSLAGQQFQSGEQQRALDNAWTASSQLGKVTPELSQLTGIPAGTNTMQAQQYWNDYNRGVFESDRNFGLQEDRNYLDYLNAIGRENNQDQPETISAAQAGQLLQQSITKQIGTDPATGKPLYGPLTDPAHREQAFVEAFNASGIEPGAPVIEMLTRAGYSTAEIAKYKQKYPAAFNSGGGASGSFSTEINASAAKWGLPTDLIEAVIQAESSGNPRAVSGAGAQGLMQLMPATARGLGVTDPFDPAQNIDGGAQYLKGLLDTYNGDYAKALAGYNAGGGRVRQAIAKYGPNWLDHMPKETQKYVAKILGNLGGG